MGSAETVPSDEHIASKITEVATTDTPQKPEVVRQIVSEEEKEAIETIIPEKKLDDAAEAVKRIMDPDKGDPDIRLAYQCMVLSRQHFQLARLKIFNKLRGKDGKVKGLGGDPVLIDTIEKALVSAAATQAEKVFDIRVLPDATISVLRNFAAKELEAAQRRVAENKRKEIMSQQAEKSSKSVRLASPVVETSEDTKFLQRGESLVIVGNADVLASLVARLATFESDDKEEPNPDDPIVLLLSSRTIQESPMLHNGIHLFKNRWEGMADKAAGTEKVVGRAMGELQVDLLVVEDLGLGCSREMYTNISSRIQEAHRRFKTWAKDRKSAMLSCIPLDKQEDTVPDTLWDSLGRHCQILFVEDDGTMKWPKQPFVFGKPWEGNTDGDSSGTTGDAAVASEEAAVQPDAGAGQ